MDRRNKFQKIMIIVAMAAFFVVAGCDSDSKKKTKSPVYYLISGQLTGDVLDDVTFTLTGPASLSVSSLGGNYSFAGLLNGTYTVTPSMTGFTFSPTSLNVTLSDSSVTGQDFVSTGTYHSIVATASANGTIDPSGTVAVLETTGQSFTFLADSTYEITNVDVDGSTVGTPISYSFTNVTAAHTIDVSFTLLPTYAITATAGANGTIDPSGTVNVFEGFDQAFSIRGDFGYTVENVVVDSSWSGVIADYSFTNVTTTHTIDASFTSVLMNTAISVTDYFSAADVIAMHVPNGVSFSTTVVQGSVTTPLSGFGQDMSIKKIGAELFVLERDGSGPAASNQLSVYSAVDYSLINGPFTTGASSNPFDVVSISSTEVWISRYGMDSILVMDPTTGLSKTVISLSETMFTLSGTVVDPDGTPEMAGMLLYGGEVFVLVQRLDQTTMFWDPAGESFIIVFDAATYTMDRQINLPYTNPAWGPILDTVTGDILVACVGEYSVTGDGGLLAINTSTEAITVLLSETNIGGYVNSVEITQSNKGFIRYTDSFWTAHVKEFDPGFLYNLSTPDVLGTELLDNVGAMGIVNGKLLLDYAPWVGATGIRIFDISTNAEITTAPINLGTKSRTGIVQTD